MESQFTHKTASTSPPTTSVVPAEEYHLLKALNEALLQLLNTDDVNEALAGAFRIVCESIGCDGAYLYDYQSIEKDKIIAKATFCLRYIENNWQILPQHLVEFPIETPTIHQRFDAMMNDDMTTLTLNEDNPEKLKALNKANEIDSYLSFRTLIDGAVWGGVSFVSRVSSLRWAQNRRILLAPFVTTVSNFLARKQTEKIILEQRDYLRQILDASPDPIFVKNLDGIITLTNKSMALGNGLAHPDLMIGKNIREFIQKEEHILQMEQEEQELLEGKQTHVEILKYLTSYNQHVHYVKNSKSILTDKQGNRIGIVSIMHDLTEVKKAEQQLRAEQQFSENITNIMPDWVLVVDFNKRCFNYHNLQYPILGFTEEEVENPFELLIQRIHPDDQEIPEDFITKLNGLKPNEIAEKQFRLQHKNGQWLSFYERARVISRDESGHVKEYLAVIQDITFIKETQIALQRSESIMKATINALPDLKFRLAKDGTYLNFYESENETIKPYALASVIIGNRIQDVMPPNLVNGFMQTIIDAIEKKAVQVYEYELEVSGAGIQYREARVSPINNEEVIAVVRNISERKRAEKALKASQERYLNFIKHSHEGIYYMNCDNPIPLHLSFDEITERYYECAHIEECNDAMARMYGTTVEKLKNTKAIALHGGEHFEENKESFKDLIKNNFRVADVETIELDANGNLKYFLNSAVGDIENEHLIGFWGTQTDITERKLATEALRRSEEWANLIFNSTTDLMFLISVEPKEIYRCIRVNAAYLNLTGITSEQLIGKVPSEILPEKEAQFALYKYQEAIQLAHSINYEETIHIDNKNLIVETYLTPIFDENGHCTCLLGVARDITERKKEEARLKLLESVITNANDAILITDAEPSDLSGPRILYANPTFTKMTGYSLEEVIGKPPKLLQGAKSDVAELNRLRKALKNWESCTIETINYKKNGEEFWVNFTVVPVADEKGWFTHWISVQRDTTERKNAEEQLQLNEERWKFAIAGSNDGMWDWNVVTNEVFFSDRWKEMLGFEAYEIKNTLEEWSKRVHPDEMNWINHNLQKTFSDPSHIYIVEHRLLCKDGNYKWIMARGKVLVWNDDGTPARMVGTHTDISERKQAENTLKENRSLLKAIIDALPDLKFRINNEGVFLDYYESEHENESSIVPPAAFIGKKIHEILPSFVADIGLQSIQNAITRQKIETFEYFMPMEAELSYYEGRVSPFGEGEVIMAIRNITDRKKAQAALQEKIRELDEKNKELTQYVASNVELKNFAYIASHDLREPIRTMHSFAQLLKKNYIHLLDEKGNGHLDFIISAAENMNQMIEDLLAYSLVNSEEHTVQSVELSSLLKSVIESLTISIREKQAVIYLEEFPTIIQANRVRLRQLFQNLISNAIKFHYRERSPIIYITGIEQDDYWLFEVKDNGIGIPKTMEQEIFHLFKKIHSNPAHVGTGIGLALCQRIVEHHGGEIWVESEPGVGSSFYFTIKKL